MHALRPHYNVAINGQVREEHERPHYYGALMITLKCAICVHIITSPLTGPYSERYAPGKKRHIQNIIIASFCRHYNARVKLAISFSINAPLMPFLLPGCAGEQRHIQDIIIASFCRHNNVRLKLVISFPINAAF
jgi:hypothetical protein